MGVKQHWALGFWPGRGENRFGEGAASPVKLGRGFARLGRQSGLGNGFELEDGGAGRWASPTPYNVPTVFRGGLPAGRSIAGSLFRQIIGLSVLDRTRFARSANAAFSRPVFVPAGAAVQPRFPELIPVAANEVPTGFIDGRNVPTAVVPGVGNGFEDPTLPHINPHWYGLTYNYFYFGGHLNGVGTGATTDFIKTTQQQSFNLAQPQVYPKAGQYPTKVSVS